VIQEVVMCLNWESSFEDLVLSVFEGLASQGEQNLLIFAAQPWQCCLNYWINYSWLIQRCKGLQNDEVCAEPSRAIFEFSHTFIQKLKPVPLVPAGWDFAEDRDTPSMRLNLDFGKERREGLHFHCVLAPFGETTDYSPSTPSTTTQNFRYVEAHSPFGKTNLWFDLIWAHEDLKEPQTSDATFPVIPNQDIPIPEIQESDEHASAKLEEL
jgi:hypothetical protein